MRARLMRRQPDERVTRVQRRVVGACFALAALAILASSISAAAQSGCSVDQLTREAKGSKRLAVRTEGKWLFFAPTGGDAPHVLPIGDSEESLCLAWEAPPYPVRKRQIVYVSTQYREDQPVWLYRSSAVASVPLFRELIGDWRRLPDTSGKDPDTAFRDYHNIDANRKGAIALSNEA